MRVLVSGSSGLVGGALKAHLTTAGHEVIALVRDEPGAGERHWKPDAGVLDPSVFEGVDAVVSLNGVGIGDRRWTEDRRRLILESRTGSTGLLAAAMAALPERPEVFVSASAIGYYGDRGDEILTEDSDPGPPDDFLVQVVSEWEAATAPAVDAGIRTVTVRTGIVLDADNGALAKLLLPFKLGVGGPLGSGKQWWSWISLVDEVRAIIHLLESDLAGPVNLTAPNPVTNRQFASALGSVLRRPSLLPVPRPALQVILGGEMANAVALGSARVIPQRLTADGFTWEHTDLEAALRTTLDR